MGSVPHPSPVLPIPSSAQLPLTKLRAGDRRGLIRVGAAKESQDKVLRGGPCPRDTKSPLTQRFSTSGKGHKGFPTWITAPSPALMIMPRCWLSQGLDGAGGHRGPPPGQEREQPAPSVCWQ